MTSVSTELPFFFSPKYESIYVNADEPNLDKLLLYAKYISFYKARTIIRRVGHPLI